MHDVIVLGGGPAGIAAAERAAELGADTCLVTKDIIGGMAATDGPIPVRTLAYAARLIREAKQNEQYGLYGSPPLLDYERLLNRIQAVVFGMHQQLNLFDNLQSAGVTLYERTGAARFVDPHTIETASGLRLQGEKFIICTGGHAKKLPVPGFEHSVTHSDAWSLKRIPASMIVVGAGATGAQVASIFNAFGTEVSLFEVAPRILWTEDVDVSMVVKKAFEGLGVYVLEDFDGIEQIEKRGSGIRFHYKDRGLALYKDADLAVMAIGWVANAAGLNLSAAGVETDRRGYIQVNEYMESNVPHIYAAGDVNGRTMLVPISSQEGYCAASNAVLGQKYQSTYDLVPTGSFTDPEYAKIGLTEEQAREHHDIAVATVEFDIFPRSLIDGRTTGFCKLIADRDTLKILGCHLVGERAVETVQLVATGMKAGLTVNQLADIPLSFPTYVEIVGWAAYDIVKQLGMDGGEPHWAAHSRRGIKRS